MERVVDRIAATSVREEQVALVELGMPAESRLAEHLIEALRRRGMSHVLEQSELRREIARRNLEQGVEVGHVGSMRAILLSKFGDLDDLAHRLVEHDNDANIARILAGATLADLRS